MTDKLPTVWPAEPHTVVKHGILRRYLEAWFPILARQGENLRRQFGAINRQPLFIDGFAGPGVYEGNEPGSPVIAIRAALGQALLPMPVRMLFIEQRQDRFDKLQEVLNPWMEQIGRSSNIGGVDSRQGDCDSVLNSMLDECESKKAEFGPALAFLDQFGYGAVSMALIRRILAYPQCEVFTYLSYKEMNRWIKDPNKAPAFTSAFGGEEWRAALELLERQRRQLLLDLYKQALKQRGGAKYVVSFLMFDVSGIPLYWLLFCTNNLRGLEAMKSAMWHVDRTGGFRFSDRDDPDQLALLDQTFSQDWLADWLMKRLVRTTRTAAEVKELVLVETPCYLFKQALAQLESEESVTVVDAPAGRRRGDYPDEHLEAIRIRFNKTLFS